MTAAVQVTQGGPKTFVPAEAIVGTQVVEARASSRVGVAGAGSLKTLGIAVTDGVTPESLTTDPVVVNGVPVLNTAQGRPLVVVAYGGTEVGGVLYAAAAAFGDRLKAAANGAVTPMGATEDCRLEVGTCTEPAGVAANARGLVRTK